MSTTVPSLWTRAATAQSPTLPIPRQIRVGGAAKPLSGRQQGNGFQEVRLAGAIIADENHWAMIDADAGVLVVSEVAERERFDPQA